MTVYSASQIEKFINCERLWAWEYILKIKPETKPEAAKGKRIHHVLAQWSSKGIVPDSNTNEGKIARAGLKFLPPPSPSHGVERKFLIKVDGFTFIGYVDLDFVDINKIPWVIDHKTTGSFIWQKTEQEILFDVQFLMYAKEALDRYKVDEGIARWVYYRTTGSPKAQCTEVKFFRDHVDSVFPGIVEIVREMEKLKLKVINPLDLPPNPHHCSAYRGCPHIERCGLTPTERIKAIMAQDAKRKDALGRLKEFRAKNEKNSEAAQPIPINSKQVQKQESEKQEESPATQEFEFNSGSDETEEEIQATLAEIEGKASRRGRPKGTTAKVNSFVEVLNDRNVQKFLIVLSLVQRGQFDFKQAMQALDS